MPSAAPTSDLVYNFIIGHLQHPPRIVSLTDAETSQLGKPEGFCSMSFAYDDSLIGEWEASPAVLVPTVGGYPGALCAVKEKC
jgi:hypothetical protein